MPTIPSRPNSTLLNQGVVTGAASAHAATSDDTDASYIALSDGNRFLSLGCTVPSLPGGAKWKQVRARVRARGTSSGRQAQVYASIAMDPVGPGIEPTALVFTTGAFAEFSTPYLALREGPAVQQVVVSCNASGVSAENLQVAEAYVDFVYANQPSCAVTAPTGVISATTAPLCAATHTAGADGGGQSQAQYRVFNIAQYAAAGFNPDFSSPFWGTDITGSASSVTPTVNLVDDVYRCYVRTAQSVNGQPHWSPWAFSSFTVSTSPPAAPTIAVTPDNDLARNRIVVTIDPAQASVVQVQRSSDSGASWAMVRGATRIAVVGSTWVGYDDETAGNNQATAYRAQALRPTVNGDIASAWSSTVSATWVSDEVWLKDPERPSRNRIVVVMQPAPQPVRPARKTEHEVLGRVFPVATSDVRGAPRGTLQLETYDLVEQAAIIALFDDQPVLLLQTPEVFGLGSIYISTGDLQESTPQNGQVLAWRQWTAPYTVVDEPADAGVEGRGGLTLDDLGALYEYPADIPAHLTFDDFV